MPECPHHNKQMKVEKKTEHQILYKCPYPDCGYMRLIDIDVGSSLYNNKVQRYKENLLNSN